MIKKKIEGEYEKLIGYFKYLITITGSAITIIVAVGLYFTYNNFNDLRKEVKESTADYKETIKEFNLHAQNAIDQTQNQTNKQISLISTEAKQLALTAAKEKIDQTFESENINKLIEDAAERKLGKEIDLIVHKKLIESTKIFDEQLNIIPDLIVCVNNIKMQGSRKSFEFLDSLNRATGNKKIKELTKNLIDGIIVDQNNMVVQFMKESKCKSPLDLIRDNNKKSITNPDTTIMINKLVQIINKSDYLNEIAMDFEALRYLGIDIRTFDFEALKKLKTK